MYSGRLNKLRTDLSVDQREFSGTEKKELFFCSSLYLSTFLYITMTLILQ